MLALRNEERSLRQVLFFTEMEERDALVTGLPTVPPSAHLIGLAALPMHYVDMCQQLAGHVSSGDVQSGNERLTAVPDSGGTVDFRTPRGRVGGRELTFPRDPTAIDLSLPVLVTAATVGTQEASTAVREQRAGLGGSAQQSLDARIAQLCDEKYGRFQVSSKDAGDVARSVLLRDGIVW